MYDLNKQVHDLLLYPLFDHELYRIPLNVNDHNVDQMKIVDHNLNGKFKKFDFFVSVSNLRAGVIRSIA